MESKPKVTSEIVELNIVSSVHENNDLFSIVRSYHISVAIMSRYDDLNRHSNGCNMFGYYFSDYK